MGEVTRTFTYTADRRACYSFVGGFAALFLLEGAAWVLGIALLVPNVAVKLSLIGALVALVLYVIFGSMLRPLWTSHRLSGTHLHLVYGRDRFDVPRAALVAARPVRERLPRSYLARAETDAKRCRITAAFSDRGQVLLLLDRPYRFRRDAAAPAIDQILVNVDDREGFVAALGLPETPAVRAAVETPSSPQAASSEASNSLVAPSPTPAVAPTSPAVAICARGLSRSYDGFPAVDNLDLGIRTGEIYGFLGPNGAGKSTTIRMLVGLAEPSAGRGCIGGHPIGSVEAKEALGYVPDRAILYERLTGREFLEFLAQMRGIPEDPAAERIERLLEMLELSGRADGPCGAYSFGMKRKLALAGALLHEPSVLILDEPLNGLDPRSARRLKDLFTELAARGVAVMLSTHDLATAEGVCHRVGILHRGTLIAEGSAGELRRLAEAPDLEGVFLRLTEEQPEAVA